MNKDMTMTINTEPTLTAMSDVSGNNPIDTLDRTTHDFLELDRAARTYLDNNGPYGDHSYKDDQVRRQMGYLLASTLHMLYSWGYDAQELLDETLDHMRGNE